MVNRNGVVVTKPSGRTVAVLSQLGLSQRGSAPIGYRRLEGGNPESATPRYICVRAPIGYRRLEGGNPESARAAFNLSQASAA